LTSNPTVFGHAITKSASYDAEIRRLVGQGLSGEKLFFELALQDLTRAANLFASISKLRRWMAGCCSKSRRSSLTTPRQPWPRPRNCTGKLTARTFSTMEGVPAD